MVKTNSEKPTKRAPKRAQIERTTKAVMEATCELLSEIGYRRLTIERISERSGVARSTIYRHFNNIPQIAVQAFDTMLGPNPPAPDEGDVRSNLIVIYTRLAKILERSIWGKVLPSLIEASHMDPEFEGLMSSLAKKRRSETRAMLIRARENGELRADARIEWMLDMMSGTLYHRVLISRNALNDPGLVEFIVDAALANTMAD